NISNEVNAKTNAYIVNTHNNGLKKGSFEQIVLDGLTYANFNELYKSLPVIKQNSKSFAELNDIQLITCHSFTLHCQVFAIPEYQVRDNLWYQEVAELPFALKQEKLINTNNKHQLNPQQQQAYNQVVNTPGYNVYLLDGVTGSGKTEVYLQLIEHYLLQGKSCLVLVPEIGLTPQTISRFRNRFNVKMHILHSNVNDQTKNQIIQDCQNGEVAILIGTRSAVFTQMQNLGCIIIDEEHDSSYKQQNDLRYHARDIAILRASKLNIPVVLGSATPSFTSLRNLELGKFKHLVLTRRASAKHDNKFVLLDIRQQEFMGIDDKKVLLNKAGITGSLWELMQQELQKDNQVLLFLNRRGFATQLTCSSCGYIFLCGECDRPLTYHRRRHELACHYCAIHYSNIPHQCPNCGSDFLTPLGAGTEQIETLCAQAYQAQKVIRIDRDTSKTAQQLEEKLTRALNTPGAILIGTQMIAKGHHFPNVTLVALLNIDSLVMSEDYRAPERLAQLYVQVAGRAGRESKQGTVVLQTALPHEKIYHDLLTLSYFNFAQIYLNMRKNLNFPPYTYQAYLAVRHQDEQIAKSQAMLIIEILQGLLLEYKQQSKRKLQFGISLHELGKQNNLTKCVVDFIIDNRSLRNEILQKVNEIYQNTDHFKKHRPIFYIDVDPYDLN
ncbi:replication restart helicase PriA, partial [Psittacicella hinzii]